MKFYSINNSLNPKVLGHYPQSKGINQNCDVWDEPKFIEHVHFSKIDFEPITANVILYSKSKQTDLISVVGMGFTHKLLVSGKLKRILEKNKRTGFQFFASPIIQDDQKVDDYWVLNAYEVDFDSLDFYKSNIYKTKSVFNKIEKLDISSFNEFIKFKKEIEREGYPFGILIDSIYLREDIMSDFIVLTNVYGGVQYLVSEKLKTEIEEAGCTGIEFQPSELSINEWLHGGEREKIYGK